MLEKSIWLRVLQNLVTVWRELLFADLIYKLLAFAILTPLFGVMLRGLLWMSSNPVLTDIDIPLFFAGPFGLVCAILLGAIWLAISALEQVSLIAILAARHQGKRLGVRGALEFAGYRGFRVLRLTARFVAWTLVLSAPLAGVAWLVYRLMLSEYDINFYLKERPPEFLGAVAIGVILVAILAFLLVRFCSSSFLALQLVVFDSVEPSRALKSSSESLGARRLRVLGWLALWFFTLLFIQVFVSACIGWLGRQVVPMEVGALAVTASRVGLMLLLVAASTLLLNVIGACSLASLLFEGYRQLTPNADVKLAEVRLIPKHWFLSTVRLTRWRLAGACSLLFLGALLVGYLAIGTLDESDHTEVMAHRGASFSAPENTLAALRQAIEDGADWVEIDVQETLDGEVVVVHDSDLMKLANNPLKIWDATAAELESIDIGSWFAASYASQRVPTLRQVLELCKGKVGVIIELKYYGHDQALEERVIQIVEELGMSEQIMVMSLKADRVQRVRRLRPTWVCGILMSVAVGDIDSLDVDFLAVNGAFVGRSLVNRVHKAKMKIFVWTVNDVGTMSMLMNRGVDGVLTDRPSLARDVLEARSRISRTERLLAEVASWFYPQPTIVEQ